MTAAPADVLVFWFGPAAPPSEQPWWFRKSDATDARIRNAFGATVAAALRGECDHWTATPRGALALILVLDQFTRNIGRDTPAAFAGDARALAAARELVATGGYDSLAPLEQWFATMPFEHSESLADQHESMRLFAALAARGLEAPLAWARKHCEVIERFGRFPHRNAILGRASTAAERAHLQRHGGF